MSTDGAIVAPIPAPKAIAVVSGDALLGQALAAMIEDACAVRARRVGPDRPRPDAESLVLIDGRDLATLGDAAAIADAAPYGIVIDDGPHDVLRDSPRRTTIRRAKGLADLEAVLDGAGMPILRPPPAAREAPGLNDPGFVDQLTEREYDVLAWLRKGASTIEIAVSLGISPGTARTHLQNVLAKMGATSRLQAVAASREPLVLRHGDARDRRAGVVRVVVGARYLLDATALGHVLADAGIETVALAGRPLAVASGAVRVAPDVLLIEGEPFDEVLQACALVKEGDAGTRVILLSDKADEQLLSRSVEAGADGFLSHLSTPAEMCDAVRRVAKGEAAIPTDMLAPLLRGLIVHRREEDEIIRRFARLTQAERRVLVLLTEGLDQAAITKHLSVSRHTVRTHVQSVLRKLEVHSQLAAATLAICYRLVERFGDEDPI